MTELTRRAFGAAVVLAVATTLAACTSTGDQTPGNGRTSSAVETGWDPAAATITVGTGSDRVDLWFDPQCPHCRTFDLEQRAALGEWATGSDIRVVLHPMTFLDRTSQGTKYSTRAATVLITAARQNPDAVLPVMSALFDLQRPEGTTGLSDAELITLAADHDVDARSALRRRPYDDVLARATADAFRGPQRITGTPTLRLNGEDVPAELYGNDLRIELWSGEALRTGL